MAAVTVQLQDVRAQHKRQLADVTIQREEERQKAHKDKEESLKRLRSDMDNVRRDLQRSHQQEKAAAQEKVHSFYIAFWNNALYRLCDKTAEKKVAFPLVN